MSDRVASVFGEATCGEGAGEEKGDLELGSTAAEGRKVEMSRETRRRDSMEFSGGEEGAVRELPEE